MKVVTPAGATIDLGETEASPTIGIVDYSRRVTDDFGVTTVVERGFARRMSVRLALPTDHVDAVQRQLAELRATPARWIADDRFQSLDVEGFYKEFAIDLAVPPLSYCTLTIEGLATTDPSADPGGDPAADGQASTLRLLRPAPVTDATFVSSTVPENDHPAWAAGTVYAVGARVVLSHRRYERIAPGVAGDRPGESTGWLDLGPTNRWAMFDQALGTATRGAGPITIVVDAAADAVALLDVVGTTVRVRATGYDRTQAIGAGAALFLDLPANTTRVTVTINGSDVAIGTLLLGRIVALGVTEAAPTAGIIDYSRKEVDDFGEATVVKRAWAKRMSARALIRTDAIDLVANRLAAVRARPSLWIGQAELDSLTVYGFFKDFSIEVGTNVSTLSLSIEGLSDAAKIEPLSDAVDWEDVGDPNGTKPANNADVTAENTAKDTAAVGGRPAGTVLNAVDTAAAEAGAARTEAGAARTEAAKVRSDLVPTIADAKAEGTAARAEAKAAADNLAAEVTRAKADTASIRTTIVALEQADTATQASIRDEAIARADQDAALANRATALETSAVRNVLVETPDRAAFTTSPGGAPELVASVGSNPAIATSAAVGPAWLFTVAQGNPLYHKALAAVVPKRIYTNAITIARAAAGTAANVGNRYVVLDADFAVLANVQVANNGALATPTTIVTTIDCDAIIAAYPTAAYIRFGFGRSNNGNSHVGRSVIRDMTDTAATRALIADEATVRADQDTALANRASALEATVNTGANRNAALRASITDEATVRADQDTALANRASALEATVNTGANRNAALRASITDEATVRADQDTALANRASALEATVNTGANRNAALRASITDEATVRADRDTALANRATALESTVGSPTDGNAALKARIAAEETTRADRDTALANRASVLEASSRSMPTMMNRNAVFSDWQDGAGLPALWYDWRNQANTERRAGVLGRYSAVMNSGAGGDRGFMTTWMTDPALGSLPGGATYVLEADITLIAGQFGGCGLHVNWYTVNGVATGDGVSIDFQLSAEDATGVPPGLGVAGRRYRFTKLVRASGNGINVMLYAMSRMGSLGDGPRNAIIEWHMAGVRLATDAEIKNDRASATLIPALTARIAAEETTRTDQHSALANRASALEATVNTGANRNAALRASITDEATVRADQDTALANRASALEATVNTGANRNAALRASITDEATVRADRDTALANRATALESTVGSPTDGNAALKARIAAEETTRADRDTALANRASVLEASSRSMPSMMNRNAVFSDWQDGVGLPALWYDWRNQANTERRAGVLGRYSAVMNSGAGGDRGFMTSWLTDPALGSLPGGAYYVLEADITLIAGQFGGCGLHVNWYTVNGVGTGDGASIDFQLSAEDATGVAPSLGAAGRRYRFTKLVRAPGNGINVMLYAMSRMGSLGDGPRNAVIEWHMAGVRLATDAEIKNDRASATLIPALTARIAATETAVTDGRFATAQRATNIEASVGAAVGRIGSVETAVSDGRFASAQRVQTLESEYGGTKATVEQQAGTIVGLGQRTSAYVRFVATAGSGRAQLTLSADANGGGGADLVGDLRVGGNLLVDGSIITDKIIANGVTNTVAIGGLGANGISQENGGAETARLSITSTGGAMKIDVQADAARSSGSALMRVQLFATWNGNTAALSRDVAFSPSNTAVPVSFFQISSFPAGTVVQFFLRFTVSGTNSTWSYSSGAIAVTEFKR